MKVETTTGIINITERQLAWLKEEDLLLDMSNYPQALPCFDGSMVDLMKLLATIPEDWKPAATGKTSFWRKPAVIIAAVVVATVLFLLIM